MDTNRVIIVGAGQAGVSCALALRQNGHAGDIVLLSDEPDMPYDRPPLSKNLSAPPAPIVARDDLAGKAIDLRLGSVASSIDRENKTLLLADGSKLGYGTLVLATGGTARQLPGLPADRRRVFTLRDIGDAQALAAALKTAQSTLIIGGGWLGLELAATARQSGSAVTVLEGAERVCQRSLPPEVSHYLHGLHSDRGITIVTAAKPSITVAKAGIQAEWSGGNGTFDLAIVAIGLVPNDRLARDANLSCEDGILTQVDGRTSDPAIFAIGDVARSHDERFGCPMRMESWKHAIAQGQRTAQVICGQPVTPFEAPWFWSEQYDRLIQIAGMPSPHLKLQSFEDGPQPLWRYGDGNGTALVIGVNRARDVRQAHRAMSVPKAASQLKGVA